MGYAPGYSLNAARAAPAHGGIHSRVVLALSGVRHSGEPSLVVQVGAALGRLRSLYAPEQRPRMIRWKVVGTTLTAVVLLAGCGSGSDTPAAPRTATPDTAAAPRSTASEPADPGTTAAGTANQSKPYAETPFFTPKNTEAINKVAARAQSAAAKATAANRLTACNNITAYPSWRRCWHALLDPYSKGLTDLAAVLTSLRKHGFPAACKAELADGAQTYTSFAKQVQSLLAGIDSKERSKQVSSLNRYSPTLTRIAGDFAEPFQKLTQACYSPEDLSRIERSPTPAPSN